MKIIKVIIPIILIFALSLPTHAMHLTENRIIDRKLTVEQDENIVKNSIEGRDEKDEKITETFIMSRLEYVKRVLIPFLVLFALGPLCLLIEYEIRNYKRKRRSQ